MRSTIRADQAEITVVRALAGASVELMRASYRTQSFPRHSHEFFTVGVVVRGAGTLWCRGMNHLAQPNDVVIIPPGEVHTGGLGPGADVLSYVALHVAPETIARCVGSTPDFAAIVVNDRAVADQLRRAESATRARGEDAEEALSLALSLAVERHAVGTRPRQTPFVEPELVRRTRELLEDSYHNNAETSLDAVAVQMGVSSFHLVRTFTRAVGLSPHQYLVQVRVRRACALLARGVSCSFVAAMTGFADQSHLTTQFKRYVGMTPATYQRCLSVSPSGVRDLASR